MRPVLECTELASGYKSGRKRHQIVVPSLDLAIHAGELVCLLGPNGAGKSTLLRTLSGAQSAVSGSIRLLGDPLDTIDRSERARRLASVFTERINVGQLLGYDLVAFGRHPHTQWNGKLDPHGHRVITDALDAVGAGHLSDRNVDELSDGERQRLMIARALAQEPAVLILDEPTAFLDVTSRIELGVLLQNLAHTRGLGIVCSTHDLDLALATADTIWLLDAAAAMRQGAPEDLALSGNLEAVFGTEQLHFDAERGTFSRTPELVGSATVIGDGLAAQLCSRALARLGYRTTVFPTAAEATAESRGGGGGLTIGVRADQSAFELMLRSEHLATYSSIQALCEHVRKLERQA